MIELKKVNKEWTTPILKDLNFTFPNTGLFALTGKKQSGKTTLLNLIGLLDFEYSGNIYYDQIEIDTIKESRKYLNQNISMYNQEVFTIPELTVINYLLLINSNQSKALDYLKKLNLQKIKEKKIKKLTKSEKAKVSLIETLLKPAKIYLLDEPTKYVEEEDIEKIINLLKEVSKNALVIISFPEDQKITQISNVLKLEKKTLKIEKRRKIEEKTIEEQNIHLLSFHAMKTLATSHLTHLRKSTTTSIIILSVGFLFFFFSFACMNIKKEQIHLASLMYEKPNFLYLDITKTTKENIVKDLPNYEISFKKQYYNRNTQATLTLNIEPSTNQTPAYYQRSVKTMDFYEIDNSQSLELVIGKMPQNANEILIDTIFAENIMHNQNWSYENLLNHEFLLDYIPIKIAGIIQRDTQKYEILKQKIPNDFTLKEYFLNQDYINRMMDYKDVYVTRDFEKYIKSQNHQIDTLTHEVKIKLKDPKEIQNIMNYAKEKNYKVTSIVSNQLENYDSLLKVIQTIGIIGMIVLGSFIVLNLLHHVQNSIQMNEKEILFLKEKGIHPLFILGIYGMELFVILSISLFISIILSYAFLWTLNHFISQMLYIYFPVFQIRILQTILLVFIFYFLSYFLIFTFYKEIENKKYQLEN